MTGISNKKYNQRQKIISDKNLMKCVNKAVIDKIQWEPDRTLEKFQETFKITNETAGIMLGLSTRQIETIRAGQSNQTPQTTILMKLLSNVISREIKRQSTLMLLEERYKADNATETKI